LQKYCLHFAEDTESRLGYAIDDRFYGLDKAHLATFRQMMSTLTLEDVNAALKKYVHPENLVFAFVTAHGDRLKEALASEAPSPIDYGKAEKPAGILAADKEIERYPLALSAANIAILPVKEIFEGAALIGGPAGAQ